MADQENKSQTASVGEKGSEVQDSVRDVNSSELDLVEYHEHNAGRLVVDPEYVAFSTYCGRPKAKRCGVKQGGPHRIR